MKILILSIILSICGTITIAQTKNKAKIYPPTEEEGDVLEKRWDCMLRNTYSVSDRLKIFPFSKYKKVVLVSFEPQEIIPDDLVDVNGSPALSPQNYLKDSIGYFPVKNKRFYKIKALETKVLSKKEIEKLTNILYNIGVKSNKSYHGLKNFEMGANCYEPRNAILFFDKKGNVPEYIEFCFECRRRKVSSEKIKLNVFCHQKYDILKTFFKSTGIKYVEENNNFN
ncbi:MULTISPECIES: hypothetical protein [Pedobacter]|uniref:hypothetical protein n=1 Tax=Pedobacter TaxID=84567 RepID=UPI001E5CB58E|nr:MULTISPECIES: hypothetical protein [Pedobacter]